MSKLEEYCLSRDIGFEIGWNKNINWFVSISNKYGKIYNVYTDGHLTKKEAAKKAFKKLIKVVEK